MRYRRRGRSHSRQRPWRPLQRRSRFAASPGSRCRPLSGPLLVHQAPVCEQMAKGLLWIAGALMQPCQIEMGVGQLRIECERLAIRREGLRLALEVLEKHGEV